MSDIVILNGYKIKDEKAVRSYETVALMKADTKLKEGYHVKTKGYYEANDGGNAEYIIVDDDTLVDDSGSIHVLTNGLRAKLIINDVVDVKKFGAYGDGTHDDSASVLSAIQHVKTNNTLYFPDGSYLITNTLLINKNINIVGEGILISNNCKPLLLIENCININISLYKLIEQEVRTLDVSDDKYLINAGIVIKDSKFINVKINEVKNFNVGCLIYSTTDTHYNNLEIRRMDNCFYGYELISHNGGSANANNFVNTVFDFHTWDTELTPYFILNKSYGSTPYKNNSNIFRGMMAEYGISTTGGPKLLYLEHTHSNIFEFDRVEIASTSGTEPLTINNDNNSNNYIIFNYAAQNFTYDNTNGANNVVKVLSGYGSRNLSNNIKNITSNLTLAEGVTIYTGGVWVDYINRVCYINVLIRNSADIQPGEDVLSGLPVPKEHVRIYTMSTNGSNPEARPADLQNLLISRSISRGALQTIVQLAFGRSTAINICYKF